MISKDKDNKPKRPEICYPCEWRYKLIGKDRDKLEACVFDIMAQKEYASSDGNISKNGKFVSMNVSCNVDSEEERNALFKAFQDHEDVKMVI